MEQAGGKIIVSKSQIPAGFIAIIIDTEENKVGLQAELQNKRTKLHCQYNADGKDLTGIRLRRFNFG